LSKFQFSQTFIDLIGNSNLLRWTNQANDTWGLRGEFATLFQILPEESERIYGFKNLDQSTTIDHYFAYVMISSMVAERLSKDLNYLANTSKTNCMKTIADKIKPSESCVRSYIKYFATKALRAKPTQAYEDTLFLAYEQMTDPQDGVSVLMQSVFLDPRFINLLEVDGEFQVGDEKLLALNDYEIAQRISYSFLQGPPSDEMLTAASQGLFTKSPESYEAEVKKVVGVLTEAGKISTYIDGWSVNKSVLNKVERTYHNFYNEWLGVDSIPEIAPASIHATVDTFYGANRYLTNGNVSSPIKNSLKDETMNFTLRLTFLENKKYYDLMMDRSAMANSSTRLYYNIPTPTETYSYGHSKVQFTDRVGLLTRAIVTLKDGASDDTHPFLRGAFIRRNILCDPLETPKADNLPDRSLSSDSNGFYSKRVHYENKVNSPSCMACHSQINSLGFALDDYDSLSRFRTVEPIFETKYNSKNEPVYNLVAQEPVNASAENLKIDLASGETSRNGVEFSDMIGKSFKGNMCFVRQVFRHTMARYEGQKDVCSLNDLYSKLASSDGSIKKMIMHIPFTDEFKMKRLGD